MRITRRAGEPEPENGLVSSSYVDPRDLGPNSPVRDLARAYLQELRDKGRSETTLPRYQRFLVEFLDFIDRDAATTMLAFASAVPTRAIPAPSNWKIALPAWAIELPCNRF